MHESLLSQATAAIVELANYEPEQLYAELELRRRAIVDNPSAAGSFDQAADERSVIQESAQSLSRLGQRFFARFNRDAYQLACGDDIDSTGALTELLRASSGSSTFAALLATEAVAHLGWSPALATVGALIVTKLVLKNAERTLCDEWRQKLPLA